MTSHPVRFGLVGYGAWGRCHAAAIEATEGATLTAIAAPSDATRAAARDSHPDATICADHRALVALDEVDVVDVVVPSRFHHEVATAVLEAGRHLLLEKPMCLSIAHCADLIERAARRELCLAVGLELRHSSLWGRIRTMIDEGFVGEPQYALLELSRHPYRLGSDGWRYDIDRVGNWILEEPIHFFDLARWYLAAAGEPVSVYAAANSRQVGHPELQDNFSATAHFPGGAYAVVSQTLAAFEHHQTVKVCGTTGALWAGWSGAMDRTRHPTFFLRAYDGKELRDVPIDRVTGEVFELEDQVAMMVRAVREHGPVAATGRDGLWSVAMCLAAQRSVETGAAVPVSTVMDVP